MIISLIFVVVSLSTIDADRYLPPLKTKQPNGLDTRTNVKPHHTQLPFCNKLWDSAKILPESAQITFLSLMSAIVKGEEIYQNVVRRSLVYRVKRLRLQKRLKKDKNHKQEDSKLSSTFMDLCMTMWDKVVEFAPPSQARIRTKLLGILEGAKHNLENDESPFSENTLPSTTEEPESEDGESDDFETATVETQNYNNNEDLEQDDLLSPENVNSIDNSDDDVDDDVDDENGKNGENDKTGDKDDDDDEPTNTPGRNLKPQIYIIRPGQIRNGNFERRQNKFYKKA